MVIYNIIFGIVLLFSLISCLFLRYDKVLIGNVSLKISNKLVLLFFFLVLIFISALRGETVGTDMVNYIPRYMQITDTNWGNLPSLINIVDFELGFIFFCKLISFIDLDNPQIFIIITSFLTLLGFYKFISKFSIIPILSLLIFISYGYWTNSFNIVRQSLAISILAWGLSLWEDDRKSLSFLMNLLAISFHISSLIFILVYFCRRLKFQTYAFLTTLFFVIGLLIMPKSVLVSLISLTPFEKYINRTGSGETTLIVLMLIFSSAFVLKKRIREFDKNIDLWLWMLAIALGANALALEIGLFERIMRFFLISLLIVIPDFCYIYRKKFGNFLLCFGILISCSFYFYFILMESPQSSGNAFPYYSVYSLE
ncbi:hypothetical protein IO44_01400 [Gallibacterium anatis str. Avicor]|uniref:EpsG family protein n=1 Tax=Gallibacterium anatis TaxID=750 RepID=UPI000531BFF6|nr:EpsG family protein [Gallibacterium anatis]KGQ57210.1 hypothetical protein IO44_01400 [Gallibacterium anatis str. Avicor]